jgi:integrase
MAETANSGARRRVIHRLSALDVVRKGPGLHCDGGSLYLSVDRRTGSRSWVFRYGQGRKLRNMGLGPTHTLSLAEARDKALACRKQRLDGIDPLEAKRAKKQRQQLEAARTMTFRQCAEAFIEDQKPGWRNAKHAKQWSATLKTYVYDVFGDVPVQAVDVALVIKALKPIWQTKPETASRLRGRIEAALDWAKVHEFRTGENPARWRGHLDKLLPARGEVRKVEHHAALPYTEIGAFMAMLRAQEGVAARALEFTILTAGRTGEVIGARWDEIDLDARLWVVPAERMKAGKEHRVPLSDTAIGLLKELAGKTRRGDFVFPGGRSRRPISNMAMTMTLRRMDRGDLTVHGFRSTFKDWASDCTGFAREIIEMALAHSIPDKTEAAYRRGEALAKRRQLMQAWARYCATAPAAK